MSRATSAHCRGDGRTAARMNAGVPQRVCLRLLNRIHPFQLFVHGVIHVATAFADVELAGDVAVALRIEQSSPSCRHLDPDAAAHLCRQQDVDAAAFRGDGGSNTKVLPNQDPCAPPPSP